VPRPRILLADDHKDMREKVVRHLEPEFEVVASVEDGCSLVETASRIKPDVCVVDISMPVMCGIEAVAHLKETGSEARIVFLTLHEDADFVRTALETGALGYVVKSRMASDLTPAVRSALKGRLFVSPCCAFRYSSDKTLSENGWSH
jgi:DNA-binding NarL/FixJ family response regulator